MSILPDDTFEIINTVAGGTSVGKYKIRSVSNSNSYLATVKEGAHVVADFDFGTEGISFPNDFSDAQALPGSVRVDETVTVTFTSATDFTVTSTNVAAGSSGTGQLNQTYIDPRTGFRFTIQSGTLVTYTSGDVLKFVIDYGDEFDVSVAPNIQIPGVRIIIPTTTGLFALDSAYLDLFDKEGQEPIVGEIYYVTYKVNKDFTLPAKLYTRFRDVEREIGTVSIENKLSLATKLCFQNGAVAVALKQLPRSPNGLDATPQDYIALGNLGRIDQYTISVWVYLDTDTTATIYDTGNSMKQHLKDTAHNT